MDIFCKISCLLLAACSWVSASENGGYYKCDEAILESDNKCIFTLTEDPVTGDLTVPEDWVQEPVLHAVDRTVGDDYYRGVQSYTGAMLSVSPKPWVNGDKLVSTSPDMITGDLWSYALIFELMAPLRDMLMYNPDALNETTWSTWTKALTDCKAKTEDYVDRSGGGTPYSTNQVYAFVKNPDYTDIHHYILQYLEEGTMDLVCLSTDVEMEHCDVIRATAEATAGTDRCNCWFDAYEAIYGACPVVDMTFTTCAGTVAPTVCTGASSQDDDGEGGDVTDDGSSGAPSPKGDPPAKGGPPAKGRR